MELRQLRYFVAIAEEGSLSRAARRLHISQPPLSAQIKSLEGRLGVRLLARTNRGITLTAAGSVFYDESRALLARLEHAKSKTRQAGRGEIGTLSVGFVSIADYGILPPALKSFRARLPLAEVHLHELTTDAQLRELRASHLDLGVGIAPIDETDIDFELLMKEELILATPAVLRKAKRNSGIALSDLSKESFIVPPRDVASGLFDLTMSTCRAAGFSPRITQHARQMQTVVGLVSCGLGIALVPSSVRNLRRTGVQYHRLTGQPAHIELGILRLRGVEAPLREHFVDALREAALKAKLPETRKRRNASS